MTDSPMQQRAAGHNEHMDFSVLDILAALGRHKKKVILVPLLVALLAAAASSLLPTYHVMETILEVPALYTIQDGTLVEASEQTLTPRHMVTLLRGDVFRMDAAKAMEVHPGALPSLTVQQVGETPYLILSAETTSPELADKYLEIMTAKLQSYLLHKNRHNLEEIQHYAIMLEGSAGYYRAKTDMLEKSIERARETLAEMTEHRDTMTRAKGFSDLSTYVLSLSILEKITMMYTMQEDLTELQVELEKTLYKAGNLRAYIERFTGLDMVKPSDQRRTYTRPGRALVVISLFSVALLLVVSYAVFREVRARPRA